MSIIEKNSNAYTSSFRTYGYNSNEYISGTKAKLSEKLTQLEKQI